MNAKSIRLSVKYMLIILAVLWIFYWTGSISFSTALNFSLGVLAGSIASMLILYLISGKRP